MNYRHRLRSTATLMLVAAFGFILAACETGSSMMQEDTLNRAEQLERNGQHAGAARAYEELLADADGARADHYRLLAARSWIKSLRLSGRSATHLTASSIQTTARSLFS